MTKKTGKIVSCFICKKEFYRPLNALKSRKKHYCSRECYRIARSSVYIGENAGNWKGGKVIERICSFCNNKILVSNNRHKKNKRVYCNKDCQLNNTLRKFKGSKCSNWQGGIGKEGYPYIFDSKLKEKIRKRDNYECQNCKITEEEHLIVFGFVLDIHHIDYNKENLSFKNLITLCRSCNVRANYNREYWKDYFLKKIEVIK